MCVQVRAYMCGDHYISVCTHVCLRLCVCVFRSMHKCVYAYVCRSVRMCARVCMYVRILVCAHSYIGVCTHVRVGLCVCVQGCVGACMRASVCESRIVPCTTDGN